MKTVYKSLKGLEKKLGNRWKMQTKPRPIDWYVPPMAPLPCHKTVPLTFKFIIVFPKDITLWTAQCFLSLFDTIVHRAGCDFADVELLMFLIINQLFKDISTVITVSFNYLNSFSFISLALPFLTVYNY